MIPCAKAVVLAAGLILSVAYCAAIEPVYSKSGVAIRGYDPVAYHTDARPVAGNKDYQTTYQGAVWYFASAEHLARFQAEPARYAPQYGGYCAYAVSQGKTARIDPDAWAIVDGKLYLNYSAAIQKKWEKDRAAYIIAADAHWPKLLAE